MAESRMNSNIHTEWNADVCQPELIDVAILLLLETMIAYFSAQVHIYIVTVV